MNRRVVALAALAAAALTACGVSAPPPAELANEIVDTLDVDQSVKDCMHDALDGYTDDDLEAITSGIESDNPETKAEADDALAEFERDLAACN